MNKSLSSLALPFAFATLNAHAFNDPVIENLPATVCLIDSKGQATLYHQHEDEGLFAPYLQSQLPVKAVPTGFKAIVSNLLPVSQPVLSAGLSGQFKSSAIEFDSKSKRWLSGAPGTIDVHIKGWYGGEPSGKCVGQGRFGMTGYIVSGKNYEPIAPGNPFYRHIGLDKNDIPRALLNLSGLSRN